MKAKILIVLLLGLLSFSAIQSQDYTSFEIENISKETAWSAVRTSFKEQNLPLPSLYKTTVEAETYPYKYNTMMTQNRLRFKVEYKADKLIVSVFDRQYLSKNQWVDNPLPMSKKQADKILGPIKNRIAEIVAKSQNNESNTETIKEHVEEKTIKEDYIKISDYDPALGIAVPKAKPGTLEEHETENVSSIFLSELSLDIMANEIRVVERGLLDKILGELSLGTSDLADPDMGLRNNRIILAGFYILSNYMGNKEKTTLNLRIVYTETGEIVYSSTLSLLNSMALESLEKEANNESVKIVAALENFAKENILILKENQKRYQ